MPTEAAYVSADHLVGAMMASIEEAVARREALAGPRARVAVQLGGELHHDHLVLARQRAWALLSPLPRARQLEVLDATLHATVGASLQHERTLRQMLGNDGLRAPLPVAERPGPPEVEHQQLQALNAALADEAQRAFAAWRDAESGSSGGDGEARRSEPDAPGPAVAEAAAEVAGTVAPPARADALAWAERACRVSFGAHDARSVQSSLAALVVCAAAGNALGMRERFAQLASARVALDGAQLGVLAGLLPSLRADLSTELDGEVRRQRADELAMHLGFLHDEARRLAGGRRLAYQFARGARAAACVARGELVLDEDDDDEALEAQVAEVLDRLAPEGAGAEELRRRGVAKLHEWRQASGDGRGSCGAWLSRWLSVVTGYPNGEVPRPVPAYDRGAGRAPRRLLPAQLAQRRTAFADAFAANIVGNASLFGRLDAYLRDALALGRPAVVCLHGPPGTAKGELAKLTAEHFFPDFAFFSRNLGAAQGADRVRGVPPNFHGAELSLFGEGLAARRGRNVFFFVDEIDHTSVAAQDALATALDFDDRLPFRDGCLDVPLRLHGDAMFFAGNDFGALQPHLRSRLERGLVLSTEVLGPVDRRRLLTKRLRVELQLDGRYGQVDGHTRVATDAALAALQVHADGEARGMRETLGALQRLAACARNATPPWSLPLETFHVSLLEQRGHVGPYRDRAALPEDTFQLFRLSLFCHDAADKNWEQTIELPPMRCEHGAWIGATVKANWRRIRWEPHGEHMMQLCFIRMMRPECCLVSFPTPMPGVPYAMLAGLGNAARGYAFDYTGPDDNVALLPQQRRLEVCCSMECRGAPGVAA